MICALHFLLLFCSFWELKVSYKSIPWTKQCLRNGISPLGKLFSVINVESDIDVSRIPSLKGIKTKIDQLISTSNIEAVQIRHIEVETEEMAEFCKSLLLDGNKFREAETGTESFQWEFSSLAANISRCDRSRGVGGDLGWIYLDQISSSSNTDIVASLTNEALRLQKGVSCLYSKAKAA